MAPTKKRLLVLVSVFVVLVAVRLAMQPLIQRWTEPVSVEQAAIRHVPEDTNWTPPKTPSREEYVSGAFSQLENRLNWHSGRHSAYVVGLYGDPDKATESIINLIQNFEDLRPEEFKNVQHFKEMPEIGLARTVTAWNGDIYRIRLSLLIPLGLTGTERAEEFLLNAYKNPRTVIALEKYRNNLEKLREFDRKMTIPRNRAKIDKEIQQLEAARTSSLTPSPWDPRFDLLILQPALRGLLYLDVEKYSSILESEYNKLLSDSQLLGPEAGAMFKTEYLRLFPEASRSEFKNTPGEFLFMDRYLAGRLEAHREALVFRDTIRELGAEGAVIRMYNEEANRRQWGCR